MSAVRSKICGITCIEDALAAVDAGADAIGLVFYPKSPRFVTVEQAQAIVAALPPFVSTVGLFVNAERADLKALLDVVPLDLIQFHGDETPEQCEGYNRPYIKALRVQAGDDIAASCDAYANACGILLDAYVAGIPGGTGETFDWALIPKHLSKPVILAGGLTSANVSQAIAQVQPYAVDVSGGVEKSKGLKDHDKIRAFMSAVHGA
ncbi:phosphoribosylanthranilate isomerase [Pseudomonas sp. CFBP 13711]|uniref:phosphoribosylanthranilate isomerase n=1 Tax=unclassified Pseudomonas TaxID=196821 RepID=UPI00178401E4|nr:MULTISPECIES: phosphoribosylanthranilate isomerase [unclassified Pseudomonas]MBD8707065.1 phosphoribosylanthranilate isomerase [Pseudomonas sp. CFBP 13711]MBD8712781.1 phosphoribosylanthranilate isomerase [Pseudomonas sp. CFBP 13715]